MNTKKPAALSIGQTGFDHETDSKFNIDYNYHEITLEQCPRFHKCSAPICPLDTNWEQRIYLRGESVCFYLHEYVKNGGKARLGGHISEKHLEAIEKCYPKIINRFGDIKRRLKRSAKSGYRIGKQPRKRIDKAA